jgi:hypothetical protein
MEMNMEFKIFRSWNGSCAICIVGLQRKVDGSVTMGVPWVPTYE